MNTQKAENLTWRDIDVYPTTGMVYGRETAQGNVAAYGECLYEEYVIGRRFAPIDVIRLLVLEATKRGDKINLDQIVPANGKS